jgi:cytochrome c556
MTDLINWVGVGTGVVGALVVAPSGVRELVRQVGAGARRMLPNKRGESVVALAGVASGSATLGIATVRAGISEDAPIASQVAQLVQSVNQLNADLNRARQDFSEEDDKLRQEIGRIEQNLRQTDKDIRQLIDAAERQEARFNARGLPLIALSIPMTGPTNILAENAVVAWSFVVVAALSVIFAIWPWVARALHLAQ